MFSYAFCVLLDLIAAKGYVLFKRFTWRILDIMYFLWMCNFYLLCQAIEKERKINQELWRICYIYIYIGFEYFPLEPIEYLNITIAVVISGHFNLLLSPTFVWSMCKSIMHSKLIRTNKDSLGAICVRPFRSCYLYRYNKVITAHLSMQIAWPAPSSLYACVCVRLCLHMQMLSFVISYSPEMLMPLDKQQQQPQDNSLSG